MNLQTGKSGIYTTKTIEADNQDCFNIFQVWGCSFNKKVLEFQRPEPLKLTTDNYFDEIKTIYNDKGDASWTYGLKLTSQNWLKTCWDR